MPLPKPSHSDGSPGHSLCKMPQFTYSVTNVGPWMMGSAGTKTWHLSLFWTLLKRIAQTQLRVYPAPDAEPSKRQELCRESQSFHSSWFAGKAIEGQRAEAIFPSLHSGQVVKLPMDTGFLGLSVHVRVCVLYVYV